MGNSSSVSKKDLTSILPFPEVNGGDSLAATPKDNSNRKRHSNKTAPSPESLVVTQPTNVIVSREKSVDSTNSFIKGRGGSISDDNSVSENLIINTTIAPGKETYARANSVKDGPPDFNFDLTEGQSRRGLMADCEFECSEILPYLFVGGAKIAASWDAISQNEITRIINCSASVVPNHFADRNNIKYLTLNMVDGRQDDISWFLCEVVQFILNGKMSGEKTLLHCEKGISRSCSFAIAYQMWATGISFKNAFNFVRTRRPICNPNTAFTCNLMELDDLLNNDGNKFNAIFRCAKHLPHDESTAVLKLLRHKATRAILPPVTSMLDPRGVFVIRPAEGLSNHIYIWKGGEASFETADQAKSLAEYFRGVYTRAEKIIVIESGKEPPDFFKFVETDEKFDREKHMSPYDDLFGPDIYIKRPEKPPGGPSSINATPPSAKAFITSTSVVNKTALMTTVKMELLPLDTRASAKPATSIPMISISGQSMTGSNLTSISNHNSTTVASATNNIVIINNPSSSIQNKQASIHGKPGLPVLGIPPINIEPVYSNNSNIRPSSVVPESSNNRPINSGGSGKHPTLSLNLSATLGVAVSVGRSGSGNGNRKITPSNSIEVFYPDPSSGNSPVLLDMASPNTFGNSRGGSGYGSPRPSEAVQSRGSSAGGLANISNSNDATYYNQHNLHPSPTSSSQQKRPALSLGIATGKPAGENGHAYPTSPICSRDSPSLSIQGKGIVTNLAVPLTAQSDSGSTIKTGTQPSQNKAPVPPPITDSPSDLALGRKHIIRIENKNSVVANNTNSTKAVVAPIVAPQTSLEDVVNKNISNNPSLIAALDKMPSEVALAREPTPVEDLGPKSMSPEDFIQITHGSSPAKSSTKPLLYQAVLNVHNKYEWQSMGVYDDDDLLDTAVLLLYIRSSDKSHFLWIGADSDIPIDNLSSDADLLAWASSDILPGDLVAASQFTAKAIQLERSGKESDNFWYAFNEGF